jgi:hypothetical protein
MDGRGPETAKGVQYHHGYGRFTAADVIHNHGLWCDPNYPGRKTHPLLHTAQASAPWRRIETLNPHEIKMHCKVVCLDLLFYYSSASNAMMFSKQWDAGRDRL